MPTCSLYLATHNACFILNSNYKYHNNIANAVKIYAECALTEIENNPNKSVN